MGWLPVGAGSAVGGIGPTAGQGFAGGESELNFLKRSRVLELFTRMQPGLNSLTKGIKELGEIQNFNQAVVIAVVEKHRAGWAHSSQVYSGLAGQGSSLGPN